MTYQATCRLVKSNGQKCGHLFKTDALPDGVGVDKQTQALGEGFVEHIKKKHPEAFSEIQERWFAFLGVLTFPLFESNDPGMAGFIQHLYRLALRSPEAPEVQKSA